jgi:hypothetical protein
MTPEQYLRNIRDSLTNIHIQEKKLAPLLEASEYITKNLS